MAGGVASKVLSDVQMLGYYHAQHAQSQKPFLAYVLQVTTPSSQFLVYRRYSQIAALATKLHFHPSVGLPPKYALQVFPLSSSQLQQRFEGLQRFLHEVTTHLAQQQAAGLHHDVKSTAGLDLQLFWDFVSRHQNRPPKPLQGALPEWAQPVTSTTWPEPDSASESEESDGEDVDVSTMLRNEVVQLEGNLSALWHCIHAYKQATRAWYGATSAVVEEYKRVLDMSLCRGKEDDDTEEEDDDAIMAHVARLVRVLGVEPEFATICDEAVLKPLAGLSHHVIAEIKHTYWTRHSSGPSDTTVTDTTIRRLQQERTKLQTTVRTEVHKSLTALLAVQHDMVATLYDHFQEVNQVPHLSQQEENKSSQPVLKPPDESTVHDTKVAVERTVSDTKVDDNPTVSDTKVGLECTVSDTNIDQTPTVSDTTIALTPTVSDTKLVVNASPTAPDSTEADTISTPRSRVYVWGRPPSFEVGAPIFLRPKSVTVLGGQTLVDVACGGEHLLYLTSTGDVYSYGDMDDKKIAASSTSVPRRTFLTPHLVQELALEKALHQTRIVSIACGAQHSLAITQAGEVYTWGSGEDGRLGHGDMRDRSVPRKVMHLLRDTIVAASCGGAHTAVLSVDGTVFTFGRGRNGRLGLGDMKCRDIPSALTPFFPPTTRIIRVVCGWNFTAAVDKQGQVYTWGKTGEGQCGIGYRDHDQVVPYRVNVPEATEGLRSSTEKVVDVACGYTHTVVLTETGDVYAWGLGEYGQLGTGDVYQPVPARVEVTGVILCPSDRLTRVYCGAFHSIATTKQHVMLAWGLNSYGACGLGHTVNKDKPERMDCFSSDTVVDLVVACGHKYTIALEVAKNLSGTVRRSNDVPYPTEHNAPDDENSHIFCQPTSPLSPRHNTRPTSLPFNPYTLPRDAIQEKEEELRRAKKLWRTRILRHWDTNKTTALAHALWRQGIPPSIRARVWPLAIGNRLKITPDMYQMYRRRTVWYKTTTGDHGTLDGTTTGREHTLNLIDTDLPRTFPSLQLFDASGPYYSFLLEVLATYACYRPDLGYIQGMSYLAAMLCLHMPDDRYLVFQCLANLLVQDHLFTFYLLDAELASVYYTLFETFLATRHPDLATHFRLIGIPSSSVYLMNWLQTLFLQLLPLEVAARVVDNFILEGTVFLFRVAMAIHELLCPVLLEAELEVALPLLQHNGMYHDKWNAHITEQTLFDTIERITVPSHVATALHRVVNDVFFYEKRSDSERLGGKKTTMKVATGGDMISDVLNGLLGGL